MYLARSSFSQVIAAITISATWPASAETIMEYEAYGDSVSVVIEDCTMIENRSYADAEDAKGANYVQEQRADLRDVSVWIRRQDGAGSDVFKVTERCESWQDETQCISLEYAVSNLVGQDIRVGCDEMYASCVVTRHLQGNFILNTNITVLPWKEDSDHVGVRKHREVLEGLYNGIEACKMKSGVREKPFREDREGAIIRAKDRVRVERQDLEVEFRKVFAHGAFFAPTICGEFKLGKSKRFLRFVALGPVAIRYEDSTEGDTFDLEYWDKHCDSGRR